MAPNIVVFITDDQPKGLLDAMPVTRQRLKNQGVDIQYGVSPSPLCAMSRASLLTGKYAGRELGVWDNGGTDGGWEAFAPYENATLATALKAVGYRTGLFGKYTNGWNEHSGVVPPGWDTFAAIDPDDGGDGDYYNYTLRGTVGDPHYGDRPADYCTDVLRSHVMDFLNASTPDVPQFLYFAPYGAHANFIAAPRHIGTWTEPINFNPSVNHANYGKAPWLASLPPVDEERVRRVIKDQHEVVMSVDEAIEEIMDFFDGTDTLFVFAGDNGLQRGSHRLNGKYVPYKASTELQMMLRRDGYLTPGPSDRITTVLDLAATIIYHAGATLPMSGIRFGQNRGGQSLEGGPGTDPDRPPYIGWRTKDYLFIKWGDGYEELYNYSKDPWELLNVVATEQSKTDQFRELAQAACKPRPLGW